MFQAMNKDEEPVVFTQLIVENNENLQPVWSNAKGQTILSRAGTTPETYFFHSRLRPSWNNMIWSGTFAERLFDLLVAERSVAMKDSRMIDPAQMSPAVIDKKSNSTSQGLTQQEDLRLLLWCLAFALFAAERFVSYRKKRKEAYER